MIDAGGFPTVTIDEHQAVATVIFSNPPKNHFTIGLIARIADAFEAIDRQPHLRAVVLASEGEVFCAGADLGGGSADAASTEGPALYREALRLFATRKPIVAAVQGAAIGGGLGLAITADFRVCAPEARLAANFVSLGIHAGFGLTITLPRVLGVQKASELLYTGRRIGGDEAFALGLADRLAPRSRVRSEALAFAQEIAEAAPLAVEATRATMRDGLLDALRRQIDHEHAVQQRLKATADFREGVRSVAERRPGRWTAA